MDDATKLQLLRTIITDLGEGDEQLFSDYQLEAFLTLNNGAVRLAAADALDTIATSEVLVSKKIRTQDLQTDGPAVAAELRAQARNQRDLARRDLDDANLFDGFDVIDTVAPARRPEHTNREYVDAWGL